MSYSGPGTGGGGTKDDTGKGSPSKSNAGGTPGLKAGGYAPGGQVKAAPKQSVAQAGGGGGGPGTPTVTGKNSGGGVSFSGKGLPGVVALDQPAPPGAVPFVEGASPLAVAQDVVTSPLVQGLRALLNGVAGSDVMAMGDQGHQTGWSAPMDHGNVSGDGSTQGEHDLLPPMQYGTEGMVFNDENPEESPIAGSLKKIISQPGVWPPVKTQPVFG